MAGLRRRECNRHIRGKQMRVGDTQQMLWRTEGPGAVGALTAIYRDSSGSCATDSLKWGRNH